MTKRALGRGLDSLLPRRTEPNLPGTTQQPDAPASSQAQAPAELTTELPIDSIVPNPFQPRRVFDPEALHQLSESIKSEGLIQPVVVRKSHDHYELIAGERRWRAAKLAGLTAIPVRIQQLPDERMLEIALVENIQREDLNPIETARAFQQLRDNFALSHEEIGQRTGKDRATISNSIRLLQLPAGVQELLETGKLSAGHGRALLKLDSAERISAVARNAVAQDWSVRYIEQFTARLASPEAKKEKPEPHSPDPNVAAAIGDMERVLGTRVRIVERGRDCGRLEIDYTSAEELDRIYSAIVRG